MQLKQIYNFIDAVAPFSLSKEYCEKYGAYDNSGVLLDVGKEVNRVLFSLDLSPESAKKAKEIGADLIITHHPAIYKPLSALSFEGQGNAVLFCAREGIGVISAHLNLDCAEDGIDDSLMHGLGGERAEKVMQKLSLGGYGKVFSVEKTPLGAYAESVKTVFHTERVVVYGEREVSKAACFCGAGMDEETVLFALENGADTYVSSDPKHHLVAMAIEGGMNVVILTHYAAETYGFFRFYEKLKKKLPVGCEFFADGRLL